MARFFIFILLLSASRIIAQPESETGFNPETIMVSRFTFTRPADWKWTSTRTDLKNVLQSVDFRAVTSDNNQICTAHINHFVPGIPAGTHKVVADRWKESFQNKLPASNFGKPVKIGTNSVSYIKLTGTYKVGDPKGKGPTRPNFTIYGAIIENQTGNLVLRLIGPNALVEKARPEFEKMIELALKTE